MSDFLEKERKESEVPQSCLILCDPMDCNLPDSSIHGIFQARVLEWGAIAFSVSLPSFHQFLTFLGLRLLHSSFCLCCHIAFYLCASVSKFLSYKGTSHIGLGVYLILTNCICSDSKSGYILWYSGLGF